MWGECSLTAQWNCFAGTLCPHIPHQKQGCHSKQHTEDCSPAQVIIGLEYTNYSRAGRASLPPHSHLDILKKYPLHRQASPLPPKNRGQETRGPFQFKEKCVSNAAAEKIKNSKLFRGKDLSIFLKGRKNMTREIVEFCSCFQNAE